MAAGEARSPWPGPFDVLVEHAVELIAVIDGADRFLYASPAALRLFGRDPLVGPPLPFVRFVHPEDVVGVRRSLRRLARGDGTTVTFEARLGEGNGQWRNVEIVATNHLQDPAVRGIVVNARDITEHVEAAAKLAWHAGHDALTGLVSRSVLFARIEKALSGSGHPALLVLDLNDFRPLNERLGHQAGDNLLAELAGRLTRACRRADTVARIGSDEFAVLAERVRDGQVARAVANRALQSLRDPVFVGGDKVTVSGSVGIAVGRDLDVDGLLRRASAALREAKRHGPNAVIVFGEGDEGADIDDSG